MFGYSFLVQGGSLFSRKAIFLVIALATLAVFAKPVETADYGTRTTVNKTSREWITSAPNIFAPPGEVHGLSAVRRSGAVSLAF